MSSSARGRGQVPALQVRVLSWRLTTRRAHNGRRVRETAPYKETGAISPPVSLRSTASLPPLAFGHFPIPSVAARHLPLTRGVGPLTGGIGPRQRGPKRTSPPKSLPLTREVARRQPRRRERPGHHVFPRAACGASGRPRPTNAYFRRGGDPIRKSAGKIS